jgi:hypothetical protein
LYPKKYRPDNTFCRKLGIRKWPFKDRYILSRQSCSDIPASNTECTESETKSSRSASSYDIAASIPSSSEESSVGDFNCLFPESLPQISPQASDAPSLYDLLFSADAAYDRSVNLEDPADTSDIFTALSADKTTETLCMAPQDAMLDPAPHSPSGTLAAPADFAAPAEFPAAAFASPPPLASPPACRPVPAALADWDPWFMFPSISLSDSDDGFPFVSLSDSEDHFDADTPPASNTPDGLRPATAAAGPPNLERPPAAATARPAAAAAAAAPRAASPEPARTRPAPAGRALRCRPKVRPAVVYSASHVAGESTSDAAGSCQDILLGVAADGGPSDAAGDSDCSLYESDTPPPARAATAAAAPAVGPFCSLRMPSEAMAGGRCGPWDGAGAGSADSAAEAGASHTAAGAGGGGSGFRAAGCDPATRRRVVMSLLRMLGGADGAGAAGGAPVSPPPPGRYPLTAAELFFLAASSPAAAAAAAAAAEAAMAAAAEAAANQRAGPFWS